MKASRKRRELNVAGPDRLIALGRAHAAARESAHGPPPPEATPRQVNAHRLRTPQGHQLYKRRGATVEPDIGNLKKILGLFSRRGLDHVTSELHLAATASTSAKSTSPNSPDRPMACEGRDKRLGHHSY